MKETLTKAALARRMNLDVRTVGKMIRDGKIKPVAKDGKGNPLFNSPK